MSSPTHVSKDLNQRVPNRGGGRGHGHGCQTRRVSYPPPRPIPPAASIQSLQDYAHGGGGVGVRERNHGGDGVHGNVDALAMHRIHCQNIDPSKIRAIRTKLTESVSVSAPFWQRTRKKEIKVREWLTIILKKERKGKNGGVLDLFRFGGF